MLLSFFNSAQSFFQSFDFTLIRSISFFDLFDYFSDSFDFSYILLVLVDFFKESLTMAVNRDSYENPYYLSSNDYSSLALVSDRLSGAAEYNSWEQSMKMVLNGRNKLCFIDG